MQGKKFKGKNLTIFKKEIIQLFKKYLIRTFPEIVFEEDEEKIKKYLKNTLIEKIIYRDIPEEFELRDIELLKNLIELFALNPGMQLNIEKLSKDLEKNKITISNYIHYLEYSLIIKTISNYKENFLSSSRKLKKVYFTKPSISFAYSDDFFNPKFLGKIMEGIMAKETNAKHYFKKSKNEIDFVLKENKTIIPIEVKYREETIEVKKFFKLLKKLNLYKGIIISKNKEFKQSINKTEIKIIPA